MSGADVVVVGSFVQDHAWFTDSLPQRGETRRKIPNGHTASLPY